jgi:hypothetical protein
LYFVSQFGVCINAIRTQIVLTNLVAGRLFPHNLSRKRPPEDELISADNAFVKLSPDSTLRFALRKLHRITTLVMEMLLDRFRLMLTGIVAMLLFLVTSPVTAQDVSAPPAAAGMNGMCKMMATAADSGATSMGEPAGMNGQMGRMREGGMAGMQQGCMMMQPGVEDSSGTVNQSMHGMHGMHGMKGMGQGAGQGMQGMKGMGQGAGQGMQGMKGMGQGAGQGMQGMKGMMMMAPDSSELSQEVINAIGVALQDEYRSESLYQRVLDDHGSVLPFANIVKAERMHASHLVDLLEAHGAPVPESNWTPAKSPSFKSVNEACVGSIQAEIDNIAVYDGLYGIDLPEDVLSTFQHLQMISREMHLPAFKACASN